MKDAIEVNIGGLQCDNPKCDYNDMSIKVEDYKDWVNKPCPKCGAILLTENDYKNVQFFLGVAKLANEIYPKREDDEKVATMSVLMNGTGNMKIGIKKED